MHASNERRYMRAQYGFRKLDLSSPIHLSFDDFEQIVAESKATWLNRDGRIEVDGFEALIREQMRQYVQRHTAQAMQGAVLSGSAIGHVLFVLKAMGTTLEDVNSRIDQMVQRDDGTCSYPGAEDSLGKASAWSQKFPGNDRKFAEISSDGRRDEALHEKVDAQGRQIERLVEMVSTLISNLPAPSVADALQEKPRRFESAGTFGALPVDVSPASQDELCLRNVKDVDGVRGSSKEVSSNVVGEGAHEAPSYEANMLKGQEGGSTDEGKVDQEPDEHDKIRPTTVWRSLSPPSPCKAGDIRTELPVRSLREASV